MVRFDAGKLKLWRKKHGLTQAEVAEKLYCTPATISRWELGLSHITAEEFARLASLYGEKIEGAFYRSLVNQDGTVIRDRKDDIK